MKMNTYIINTWVRNCEEQLTDAIQYLDLEACVSNDIEERDGLKCKRVDIENEYGDIVTSLFYATSDDGYQRKIYAANGSEIGLELSDVVRHIESTTSQV
jgi:hypothetical protein